MQFNPYICIVRISTSYHNKAICRRSSYLRPRFGEGILFVQFTHSVTLGSLRLRLELSGEGNCIEFHLILSDCKRRNPQNLAGSVPKTPLIQQHCAEVRNEATSPPLTKGDLGGMSILVSQKRSRKNRLLFCDSGGKDGWSCLLQTFNALCQFSNVHSPNTLNPTLPAQYA